MNQDDQSDKTMGQYRNSGRFEGIAAVEAYWQALRGNRTVPLRSDVDPRGIETALDFAFIVERTCAGVIRFRLAGSQLSELMGMDVRGMPLTSLFTAESRSEVSRAFEAVFSGPEILEIGVVSPAGAQREMLFGQMMLLPLKSDLGDISRALGCFPTRGKMGRAPRRFELAAAPKRIPLGGIMPTRRAPAQIKETSLIGMAEQHARFAPAPRMRPFERPYLRLVEDDER
ncbi:PAS domain-containing protein [Shimia ponticola]|uniref:PAS domain-containing protein n=1 Tax=Shimia ponticola TaxID=2582893 RepID=UPI0011BEB005|nr:PAS domain-containing protein [Shimia ponticola]